MRKKHAGPLVLTCLPRPTAADTRTWEAHRTGRPSHPGLARERAGQAQARGPVRAQRPQEPVGQAPSSRMRPRPRCGWQRRLGRRAPGCSGLAQQQGTEGERLRWPGGGEGAEEMPRPSAPTPGASREGGPGSAPVPNRRCGSQKLQAPRGCLRGTCGTAPGEEGKPDRWRAAPPHTPESCPGKAPHKRMAKNTTLCHGAEATAPRTASAWPASRHTCPQPAAPAQPPGPPPHLLVHTRPRSPAAHAPPQRPLPAPLQHPPQHWCPGHRRIRGFTCGVRRGDRGQDWPTRFLPEGGRALKMLFISLITKGTCGDLLRPVKKGVDSIHVFDRSLQSGLPSSLAVSDS